MGTGDWGLETRDSGLETRDWGLEDRDTSDGQASERRIAECLS